MVNDTPGDTGAREAQAIERIGGDVGTGREYHGLENQQWHLGAQSLAGTAVHLPKDGLVDERKERVNVSKVLFDEFVEMLPRRNP